MDGIYKCKIFLRENKSTLCLLLGAMTMAYNICNEKDYDFIALRLIGGSKWHNLQ